MRTTKTIIVALVAFLALGLTGCSDDDKTSTDTTKTAPGPTAAGATGVPPGVTLTGKVNDHGKSTATGNEIKIDVYDNYFGPTFVKVEPNKTYTVQLHNEGQVAHTFTATSVKVDIPLAAGDHKTAQLTTPASGFVEFICKPHAGGGMRGALYI